MNWWKRRHLHKPPTDGQVEAAFAVNDAFTRKAEADRRLRESRAKLSELREMDNFTESLFPQRKDRA